MYEKTDSQKQSTRRADNNSVTQYKNQKPTFTDNRSEAIAQRKLQNLIATTSNRSPIQCFPKETLKQGLGSEFLHKHIAHASPPAMDTQEQKENVLESVYYHRPKGDRRDVNTVFFASPDTIEADLRGAVGDELSYGEKYTTTNAYPAITVLRVYREKEGKYARAQIQYGDTRPVVKINNGDGAPSFNHLQETNPKALPNKVDVETDHE